MEMGKDTAHASRSAKTGRFSYSLKEPKSGRGTFSSVSLANGQNIRIVDRSVHDKALKNVSRAYAKDKK
jgi:hypothetical protein